MTWCPHVNTWVEQGVGKIIGGCLVRKLRDTVFLRYCASKVVTHWTNRGEKRQERDKNSYCTDGDENGPLTPNSNTVNLIYISNTGKLGIELYTVTWKLIVNL